MDNRLAVPPRAPGANLYRSSHSEKKLLTRAKIERRCWSAEITGTAVRACEFLARQAHEAQPHGDADPLLGSAEGGGRRAANFHPRHSQAVTGAREGSRAVPVLSSTHLWTRAQQGARSSLRGNSFMQPSQLGHGGCWGKQQEPRQSGCPREDTQDKGSTDCSNGEEGLVLFLPSSPERGKPWQGLRLAVTVLWTQAQDRQPWLCHSSSDPVTWHSSTLPGPLGIPARCLESPAPLHRVTAQPGRSSPTTAGPARCWARTWICPSFIFFSRVQPLRRAPRSAGEQLCRKEAFRFPASEPRQKEKSKCKHTLSSSCSSSSPSYALAPPLQPLIKEISPSTYGSCGRRALPSLTPGMSPVTCYSPLVKLKTLSTIKKKFRDLIFIREFSMQDRQIFGLPGTSVSSMDAKKRMIGRPPFASFEPPGQLKQFGTFQPSLPTVLQWLHTQSSRCHLQIPGVIRALCSRGLLLCRYLGAPAGPSSARGNAEITKGFCLPSWSQPMLWGSS